MPRRILRLTGVAAILRNNRIRTAALAAKQATASEWQREGGR
uniref:Phage tail protein n=1 Tax=Macrostomum lignano TaxID=282301 RepID=A0A1I8IGF8_9PLAT